MKVSPHTAQAFLRPFSGGPVSLHSVSPESDFKVFGEFCIVWIGFSFDFDMSDDWGIKGFFKFDILVFYVFLAVA